MDNQFTHSAFTNYLNAGLLMGSRDKNTGQVFLPPRPVNPANYSTDMEWYEFGGRGVLEAYTIIYTAPSAMLEAGYDRMHPYCVGVVKTAEGPMISALIMGVDTCTPESIRIGMPLKVKFANHLVGETQKTFLAFEPA